MYFLQSLPRHLLGFHDLLLFLNLFNKIQFFILFSYACCSVDAHYLKIIFVEFLETCFCGFTKLSRRLLNFLVLFDTSLYFSRCDRAQISDSLYHIKTIDSSCCAGSICSSSSGTNIATLSVSNFIRSKFI